MESTLWKTYAQQYMILRLSDTRAALVSLTTPTLTEPEPEPEPEPDLSPRRVIYVRPRKP